jgi:protein required for attachment to host cells
MKMPSRDALLWIVVADGEHARFVTPAPKRAFHTQRTMESPSAHKQSSDLGTDRPASSIEGATGTRHAITPKHDLHEMAKRKFAGQVAHEINRASGQGAFDRLVVVAPAHALNEIRDQLDVTAAAKLAGTLQKDLIKVPDHELASHLDEWALHD